jgi:hypothetical protein
MQACINIAHVGDGAPMGPWERRLGPADSLSSINILNGFARQFFARNEEGAFSVKWIPTGAARYEVEGVAHRLSGDKLLVLQAGQPYDIEFLDRTGTESFCLFFPEDLVRQARPDGELEDCQPQK